jgi:hypothetical protein
MYMKIEAARKMRKNMQHVSGGKKYNTYPTHIVRRKTMTEGKSNAPEKYDSIKVLHTRKMKYLGNEKPTIEKMRCKTNIYDSEGSMPSKLWRIYYNNIEA